MRGRYLLEAPTELLDAGKAEAKRRKVSFAELLRTALGKEIGTERLAEPGTNGKGTAEEAPVTAKTSVAPGSVSPPVPYPADLDLEARQSRPVNPMRDLVAALPSLPAPKVERCGFRNPLVPAQKCALGAGHEGRHTYG